MKRATGARALRTIIEEVMLDIMYEIPSRRDVKKVIVTRDTILARQGTGDHYPQSVEDRIVEGVRR